MSTCTLLSAEVKAILYIDHNVSHYRALLASLTYTPSVYYVYIYTLQIFIFICMAIL